MLRSTSKTYDHRYMYVQISLVFFRLKGTQDSSCSLLDFDFGIYNCIYTTKGILMPQTKSYKKEDHDDGWASLTYIFIFQTSLLGLLLRLRGSRGTLGLLPLFSSISPALADSSRDGTLDTLRYTGPSNRLHNDLTDFLTQTSTFNVFGNALLEWSSFSSPDAIRVLVLCLFHQRCEFPSRDSELGLILEVELVTECVGQSPNHMAPRDRVHVLGDLGIYGGVIKPVSICAGRVVERDVG